MPDLQMSNMILLIAVSLIKYALSNPASHGFFGTDIIGMIYEWNINNQTNTAITSPGYGVTNYFEAGNFIDNKANIFYQPYNTDWNGDDLYIQPYQFNCTNPEDGSPCTYKSIPIPSTVDGRNSVMFMDPSKIGQLYLFSGNRDSNKNEYTLYNILFNPELDNYMLTKIKTYTNMNETNYKIDGILIPTFDTKRNMVWIKLTDEMDLEFDNDVVLYQINPVTGEINNKVQYNRIEVGMDIYGVYYDKLDVFIGFIFNLDNNGDIYSVQFAHFDPNTWDVVFKSSQVWYYRPLSWCEFKVTDIILDGIYYTFFLECNELQAFGYLTPFNIANGTVTDQKKFCIQKTDIHGTPISICPYDLLLWGNYTN